MDRPERYYVKWSKHMQKNNASWPHEVKLMKREDSCGGGRKGEETLVSFSQMEEYIQELFVQQGNFN